jgi:hypothetical protein
VSVWRRLGDALGALCLIGLVWALFTIPAFF